MVVASIQSSRNLSLTGIYCPVGYDIDRQSMTYLKAARACITNRLRHFFPSAADAGTSLPITPTYILPWHARMERLRRRGSICAGTRLGTL